MPKLLSSCFSTKLALHISKIVYVSFWQSRTLLLSVINVCSADVDVVVDVVVNVTDTVTDTDTVTVTNTVTDTVTESFPRRLSTILNLVPVVSGN